MGYIAYDRFGVGKGWFKTELVIDNADILSEAQEKWVEDYHAAVLKAYDIDLRLITTKSDNDINKFAVNQFEKMETGSLSTKGLGMLYIVNPKNNKVRMEVGRDLEGIYTDSFVDYIEREQMVSFFRDNRISDGILATTELIVGRIQEAIENVEFDADMLRKAESSTGAGATTKAMIGEGGGYLTGDKNIEAVNTPMGVVETYLEAMKNYNANPNLDIYTDATKRMMSNWRVTKAQMKNVYNSFSKCDLKDVQVNSDYAVVRYKVNQRQCNPYFLQKENGQWKLDLTVMQKGIRFNHKNEWHFKDKNIISNYSFAFSDWIFDRYGFPHAP